MTLPTCALVLCAAALAFGQTIPLSPTTVKPINVKVGSATYKGKSALRIEEPAGNPPTGDERVAIVALGAPFHDGTITAELAGEPGPGASEGARGFVGIAFRAAADLSKFECLYLRPTNGRADDQVRRNHSVQYISHPDYPWQRLRKETPERYESYADLVPGEWTKVRIEVNGDKARLFVNGATQPNLLVNDLKLGGAAQGGIGLWIGPGTVAHFANLTVADK